MPTSIGLENVKNSDNKHLLSLGTGTDYSKSLHKNRWLFILSSINFSCILVLKCGGSRIGFGSEISIIIISGPQNGLHTVLLLQYVSSKFST
jgi:hypothetical protein